jgi:hypothetical protein
MPIHVIRHQRMPTPTRIHPTHRQRIHQLIHLTTQPQHLTPNPRQLLPRPRMRHPLHPQLPLQTPHPALTPHRHRSHILSPHRLHKAHTARQTPSNIHRRQTRQSQPRHQPRTIRRPQLRHPPKRPRRTQHTGNQLLIRNPPQRRRPGRINVVLKLLEIVVQILHNRHDNQPPPLTHPTRRPIQTNHRPHRRRHTRKPHTPTSPRHQHIMRNHQGGKAVRLVLPQLPPHRRSLKPRQMTSHPHQTNLKALQQTRRPSHRIPNPRPPLRRPRRHRHSTPHPSPPQRLTHNPQIRLPRRKTLHRNLRRTHRHRQRHSLPRPLIRRHRGANVRHHSHHTIRPQRRRHNPTRIPRPRIRRIHTHHNPNRRMRSHRQPPRIQPLPLHKATLRRSRHPLIQGIPRPLTRRPPSSRKMLRRKPQRRHHRHTRSPVQRIRNTSRRHRRNVRMPPHIRLRRQQRTRQIRFIPPSHNQHRRSPRMHTRRQRRPILIQNPLTMRLRISLSSILNRIINQKNRRNPKPRHTRIDTRRQHPTLTTINPPTPHRRLIRRQPKPQILVVLLNQLTRLTAMRLGQLVAVRHQNDLRIRVLHQRPHRSPNRQQPRLPGTRRARHHIALIRLPHRTHRDIGQQPDRRRHPERRIQAASQLSRRTRPTRPPRRRHRTHTHQTRHHIHQPSVARSGDAKRPRVSSRALRGGQGLG